MSESELIALIDRGLGSTRRGIRWLDFAVEARRASIKRMLKYLKANGVETSSIEAAAPALKEGAQCVKSPAGTAAPTSRCG